MPDNQSDSLTIAVTEEILSICEEMLDTLVPSDLPWPKWQRDLVIRLMGSAYCQGFLDATVPHKGPHNDNSTPTI